MISFENGASKSINCYYCPILLYNILYFILYTVNAPPPTSNGDQVCSIITFIFIYLYLYLYILYIVNVIPDKMKNIILSETLTLITKEIYDDTNPHKQR